ncbi:MAG: hypothetical protein IJ682_05735 [Lachnospiraceae bacterium]|nr:hypothetical protein [Lachnospiraceae bacterium]
MILSPSLARDMARRTEGASDRKGPGRKPPPVLWQTTAADAVHNFLQHVRRGALAVRQRAKTRLSAGHERVPGDERDGAFRMPKQRRERQTLNRNCAAGAAHAMKLPS